jgi:hypothetical protein
MTPRIAKIGHSGQIRRSVGSFLSTGLFRVTEAAASSPRRFDAGGEPVQSSPDQIAIPVLAKMDLGRPRPIEMVSRPHRISGPKPAITEVQVQRRQQGGRR